MPAAGLVDYAKYDAVAGAIFCTGDASVQVVGNEAGGPCANLLAHSAAQESTTTNSVEHASLFPIYS